MKDWMSKLTDENVLAIHRNVICPDTQSVEISRSDSCLYVTAYENWPDEDGTPSYVPTEYIYHDFVYEDCDTSGKINAGAYRTELTKILGKEYLFDLTARLTEMDEEFLKEMLK